MTEQETFEKLLPLLREVTGARAEQVTMASNLMDDLGAESIDLLDLSFLIEEAFGITIEADEFERQATEQIPDGQYERDGLLTAEALEELKKALPEVPAEKFRPGLKKIEVPSVLNVGVFVHLIQRKVAQKQEAVDA
ncbi:MAG: phosphopantetheine-binding protein [Planctomycetota bacterium]|nr:phosphopantetheine-binding protein [Planctomycetota bacterium]